MSDLRQGTLRVRTVKRGKQVVIEVPTRKGSHLLPVNEKALSADLEALPESQLNGLEVEYELENNQPVRVRRQGQPWRPARREGRPHAQPEGASSHRHQRRGRQQRPKPISQRQDLPANGKPAFHNPYNFIPAPPRVQENSELADQRPIGHHRYFPDRWSGCITVQLTTETPLLIPDAARVVTDHNEHKIYPARMTADGQPYLPPTSIKGMLHAAYEAVTNSRMSVFHGHKDRLAYRMPAGEGLALVPARINGGHVELLLGTTSEVPWYDSGARPWNVKNDSMHAAWLPRYDSHGGIAGNAIRFSDGTLPEHGEEIWAWVEKIQYWGWRRDSRSRARNAGHHQKDFQYWRVRGIARAETQLGPAPGASRDPGKQSGRSYHQPLGESLRKIRGYACITNQNISRKHDERVFFIEDGHPRAELLQIPLQEPISDDPLAEQWRELIDNYQAAHREQDIWDRKANRRVVPPEQYIGAEPGKTAWSRHIYQDGKPRRDNGQPQPDADRLQHNCLCYARVEQEGDRYRVTALYPVIIARELFQKSPVELLPDLLKPAMDRDKLSPADRVFGWVNQDGKQAYRGNLRIGPVRCETQDAIELLDQGVTLAILGQPKPQQARFYVAKDKQGTPLDKGTDKKQLYMQDQGLRGRKAYPHHAGLPDGYWNNPAQNPMQPLQGNRYKEYRRLPDRQGEDRDGQNRSITAWVKPKAVFTFDIHLTNLSDAELSALLWLLNLQEGYFHRLGGAKPLGFGSVHLEIQRLDLRDGQGWASWYRSLTGTAMQGRRIQDKAGTTFATSVDVFKKAVQQAYGNGASFDNVPFVKAFLHAAQGYSDGLPIHYPRCSLQPDPEGENFKWFGENEREPRHSLGALYSPDPGLPRLDRR